ncbi:MAG: hypothetical protein J6J56_01525, partial [Rikenellaceae bacterium]|nr:hypothetical protein [Rikenellaceae bacterium]
NLYGIKSRKQQERPKGYGFCKLSIARLNRKKQNTPIWQTHKKIKNGQRLRVLHAEHSPPQPKKSKTRLYGKQKKSRTAKGYGFCTLSIARHNRKSKTRPYGRLIKNSKNGQKATGFANRL